MPPARPRSCPGEDPAHRPPNGPSPLLRQVTQRTGERGSRPDAHGATSRSPSPRVSRGDPDAMEPTRLRAGPHTADTASPAGGAAGGHGPGGPGPELPLALPEGTHRSSCAGCMYPDDRMLRDKMLGSIRDSSVSGVFRMRPTEEAMAQVTARRGTSSPGGHRSMRRKETPRVDREVRAGSAAARCHGSVCGATLSARSLSSKSPRLSAVTRPLCPSPHPQRTAVLPGEKEILARRGGKCTPFYCTPFYCTPFYM